MAVTRRDLFSLGAARIAQDLTPRDTATAPPEDRSRTIARADPHDRSERHRAARARCDTGGLWAPACEALVDAVGSGPGRLLAGGDADGHLSRTAAGRGWDVTAGDAQTELSALAFDDASFDVAAAAFAPAYDEDPRRAVEELFRVVRPGGIVVYTSWRRAGVIGSLLRLAAECDPPPHEVQAPLYWGLEKRVRWDLAPLSDEVRFTPLEFELAFADRDEAVDRLLAALSPLVAIPGTIPLRAKAAERLDLMAPGPPGPTTIPASYLLTHAVVPPRQASA